jgi:caffeoyl-CoA O-methyltransferase
VPTLAKEGIEAYAEAHTSAEPERLRSLADETVAGTDAPGMMVGQLEGRFLKMLVAMLRPRRILEIGTFTGYSSLSMAEAVPPGGTITTCEISEKHAAIARKHIAASPYAERIEIRMGPAMETLGQLDGPFDFVFIDADKGNYRNYFEAALSKLSPEGIIAIDNVLWSGRVLDGQDRSEDTAAIRALNDAVIADPRVECVLVPIRDGLTLVRRIASTES